MLFIVAGTAEQAYRYAMSINLQRNEYRYVWSPNVLRGMSRGLKFVRVGTWSDRKDLRRIFNILKGREAVETPRVKTLPV